MIWLVLAVFITLAVLFFLVSSALPLTIKLVSNVILGVIIVLLFNLLGAGIPINWVTLLILSLFGVPGAGTLGVLAFTRML